VVHRSRPESLRSRFPIAFFTFARVWRHGGGNGGAAWATPITAEVRSVVESVAATFVGWPDEGQRVSISVGMQTTNLLVTFTVHLAYEVTTVVTHPSGSSFTLRSGWRWAVPRAGRRVPLLPENGASSCGHFWRSYGDTLSQPLCTAGPVPAGFTAATEKRYRLPGVSPSITNWTRDPVLLAISCS
jgi:hypothetical protein